MKTKWTKRLENLKHNKDRQGVQKDSSQQSASLANLRT